MKELSAEQKAAYLKTDGQQCPLCGSDDISAGSVDIEGGSAVQEVTCSECDTVWNDRYTLTDVELDYDPNACTKCGEDSTGGDGYDGLCGNCADKAERRRA
jgi:formate dehydrogenase maturation protein FdhE